MSATSFPTDTQEYFERVMVDFQPSMDVEHPYATNMTWRRNYAALRRWIEQCGLEQGRVLEIGSGLGLLQHVVPNYVGTDLAANASVYMWKPFCASSATRLPFPDNSFDGLWTIWVIEHIEQPEAMLDEIRRVLKPGGSAFITGAYAVAPWISEGLHKRPWSDLTWRQRLTKLTIPLRGSAPYRIATTLPLRLRDLIGYLWNRRPTSLRYGRLRPNYQTYWDYDADACVSLDSYNLALYFLSRGDTPVIPAGPVRSLLQRSQPQAYRIHKRSSSSIVTQTPDRAQVAPEATPAERL